MQILTSSEGASLLRRFDAQSTITASGCVEWTGYRDKDGYGTISFRSKVARVHRLVLQMKLGRPIALGSLTLHECDNPSCMNPQHLREGTQSENIQQAFRRGRKVSPEQNSVKTVCPHGHPYDAVNTYLHRNKRYCRTCVVATKARYRARQRTVH